MRTNNNNTEKAEYLIDLREEMGETNFRSYYNRLKRKTVIKSELDKKFKEMLKEEKD
jgi:hypothetical protein